jgi:hypothetical protein
MKKIDLSQAIQTTANLGVLAGIIFLAYEIRQNTTATQLMASESHMAAVVAQNDLIYKFVLHYFLFTKGVA